MSSLPTVVLLHGLWLSPTSWDPWRAYFEGRGFPTLAPKWPGDARAHAEAPIPSADRHVPSVSEAFMAFAREISKLDSKPIVIGHSFGGMFAQMIAGHGLASATIAIAPAAFRGVLPLPVSALRSAWPVLKNPSNRHRQVPLNFRQFQYAFANALTEREAERLYTEQAVPAPGRPLFQAAFANLNWNTEVQVDTRNPQRGPLLILAGERDHTVPLAVARAAYRLQRRNPGLTEFEVLADRGHALTIDSRWQTVAKQSLDFALRAIEANHRVSRAPSVALPARTVPIV